MTRCSTILCGNEAIWQRFIELDNGATKPFTYKCETRYERSKLHLQEGWTRIEAPTLLASRIIDLRRHNAEVCQP